MWSNYNSLTSLSINPTSVPFSVDLISLGFIFLLFECLGKFYWILDNTAITMLSVRYSWFLPNVFEICSRIKLSHMEAVWLSEILHFVLSHGTEA